MLIGGLFSVDAFFFLSGFLVTVIFLEHIFSKDGEVSLLKVYFHRYYRLIFPVAATTLIGATLSAHMGNGPIWPVY